MAMDKKEIITVMKKKGYVGAIIDRIPMFQLEATQNPTELKKAIREAGYLNSFGYTLLGKGQKLPKDLPEIEESEQPNDESQTAKSTPEVVKESEEKVDVTDDTSVISSDLSPEKESSFDLNEDYETGSIWTDQDDFFENSEGQFSFFQ